MVKKILFSFLCCLPLIASAQDDASGSASNNAPAGLSQDTLQQLLRNKIRTVQTFALNPMLINLVHAQNGQSLSMDDIKQRDDKWTGSEGMTPFKLSLQRNKAGRFLKRHVEANPAITEAFLTDNQGANVAAFPITSDYWQGDEEKWSASYNDGNGQLFIGPVEFDESTKTESVQISAPIIDQNETLGVLVVGISLSYIQDQQQQ